MVEAPVQRTPVVAVQPLQHRVPPLLYFAAEQETAQHRSDEQSKHQRPKQCKRHRPRHRTEQASLHSLQRKNRQIRNDDNNAGEKHRLLHFVRGGPNDLHERLFLVSERSMAQDVLHHHNRPVHHHAEIKRAQRQEICRNLPQVQQNRREQKREGNRDGHNQRAAHIPQKQKQNQRDQ